MALANGESQAEAYRRAFGTDNRSRASSLAHSERVAGRVEEIINRRMEVEEEPLQRALDRAEVSKYDIVKELKAIGFARMDMFTRVNDQGEPIVDLTNVTTEQWAAVKEVVVDQYTEGHGDDAREVKRVRIQLHDKLKPLIELARMRKMIVPVAVNTQNNTQINVVLSETDAQL